jgi:uncharacterized protein (DUF1800 family)
MKYWVVSILSILLVACGGSGGGDSDNTSSTPVVSSSISSSSVQLSSMQSSMQSSSSISSSTQSSVGSSASSSSASQSSSSSVLAPDLSADPELPIKDSANYNAAKNASRFLAQTTFGATPKSITRVMQLGQEAWIDEQFAIPQTFHLPLLDQRFTEIGLVIAPPDPEIDNDGYYRDLQRSDIWWEVSLWGQDQLRQRVAYALSQILVISNVSDVLYNDTRGIANYQDILATHAFGNYRDLLEAVTLNPMMGQYLSMIRNEKADTARNIRPDENYARELMQLFSIGLVELNQDGSVKLDENQQPIPTYDQTTVKELARVFTGWNMSTASQWWEWKDAGAGEVTPMKSFVQYHDLGEKTLFGNKKILANKSPINDVRAALDIIFAHPNVAPFISKQLIQRLVTSNPTPEYVAHVAGVFNDNGSGVKGDMKAVIKAILLHEEAQQGHQLYPDQFGKIREPLLVMSHLWRAFKATGVSTRLNDNSVTGKRIRFLGSSRQVGQRPFGSNSVFNFYRPDYQQPGTIKDLNLVSPEFQILTESVLMAKANTQSSYIFWRDTEGEWLEPVIDANWDLFPPRLNIEKERTYAYNPSELLDRLNLILMAGQMSDDMYTLLSDYLNANKVNPSWGAEGRRWATEILVYEALFLVISSPEYAVQR